MNEEKQLRRVPAQPGWVVDVPAGRKGEPRIRWAVLEWAYDPADESSSALCLGPLGYPSAMQLAEFVLTEQRDLLVRMATSEELRDVDANSGTDTG